MDHEFTSLYGWILEGHKNTGDPFTKCGAVRLVGGYNKFGRGAVAKRTFTIPSHSKIRI